MGVHKEARERPFIRNCTVRTNTNRFKLEEVKFMLDIEEKFFTDVEVGEALEQIA